MIDNSYDGEKPDNKSFTKEFPKCPGCGSEERYFEGIINELKDRGLLDTKIGCFDFQLQQGIALPQQKMAVLPFGSEIPSFKRIWDTCCNCGMVYSTYLERATVKKSLDLATPQNIIPNRADRRRMERLSPN